MRPQVNSHAAIVFPPGELLSQSVAAVAAAAAVGSVSIRAARREGLFLPARIESGTRDEEEEERWTTMGQQVVRLMERRESE